MKKSIGVNVPLQITGQTATCELETHLSVFRLTQSKLHDCSGIN